MQASLILHFQHNWPLAIIALGLLIFIPIVLITGVFPTNQGSVLRSHNPASYWRWVAGFVVILLAAWIVLFVSFRTAYG